MFSDLSEQKKKIVELKYLWIDENILYMVKKQGYDFPEELEENLMSFGTFPLQQERLKSLQTSSHHQQLPAISVMLEGLMYRVLDGRHRITNCILQGKKEIECLIVS